MLRKASATLLAAASIASVGSFAVDAGAQPTMKAAAAAAACVQSHGKKTTVSGNTQQKWTEYFTHNCAGLRVRAQVKCRNQFSNHVSTDYGKTINGTGYSSYTCSIVEQLVSGRGQYYNFQKWVNLPK